MSSRSHMYRRTRRKRLPVIIALLVILCGSFVVFRWRSGGSAQPANADTNAAGDTRTASTTAPPMESKPSPPPAKKPEIKPEIKPDPKPDTRQPPKQDTQPKISMGGTNNTVIPAPPVAPPVAPFTTPVNPPKAATPAAAASSPPSLGDGGANQRVSQHMAAGLELLKQNKPVEARKTLSAALFSPGVTPAEAEQIRGELTKVNQRLLFSPEVVANDPFVSTHTIESGELLSKLPRQLGLNVDWRFLQRINGISAPERIQPGQRLKVATGPFHAVVVKKDFRMDLYMGGGGDRVFVRSFTVGLGEHDATPEGVFTVKPNSKLIDPEWVNPRTGERFGPKDPKNPIGDHWIGLVGESDNIRGLEGYGVHGTIDPDSIGAMKSMGCIRLANDDIALVYELLMDGVSTVEIHGEDYP